MTEQPAAGATSTAPPPQESTPNADELWRMTLIGARPRLAFVLGGMKAPGIEDLTRRIQAESDEVLDGGVFSPVWERVLRPLGAWSYGVHHLVRDLFLIDDVAAATGLRRVSVLSIGRVAECDVHSVRNVLDGIGADLVVCAGGEAVYWPLAGHLELGCELLTTAYDEPIRYSVLHSEERQTVILQFWDPIAGYHAEGGHHRLFKLLLHAYDALCRKRLLSSG